MRAKRIVREYKKTFPKNIAFTIIYAFRVAKKPNREMFTELGSYRVQEMFKEKRDE